MKPRKSVLTAREREESAARALRENLTRRKEQQRAWAEAKTRRQAKGN